MVALAATGALIVGGGAAAMVGTGTAAPLPDLPGVPSVPGVGTTYVTPPDLAPFVDNGTREGGEVAVSDEFGAPPLGGQASLKLATPGDNDKASIRSAEDAGSALEEWIPTAAYSAFQSEATNPIQFPSLQLIVDYNGAETGGFATLFYEPYYNDEDLTPGEWHRYQAGAGRWCSTKEIPDLIGPSDTFCSNNGLQTLAAYATAAPDLVVNAVSINQGSGNPGLIAAVDLVSTPSTTYDFELTEPEVPGLPGEEPCEEPGTPMQPGEGDGGNEGHEGHENGGKDEPQGHEDNGGHEDGGGQGHDEGGNQGHDEGGNEGHEPGGDEGHEPGGEGGHEPPPCSGS